MSESFVRRHWPHENPIGRRFHIAFLDRTIVGVVADIRVRGLERNSEPQVYLPYRQVPDNSLMFYSPKVLVIRSSADTAMLLSAVRQIIQKADPELPISNVQTLQDVVDSQTVARVTQIRVIVAFAVLSILLAGIGIHGLLACPFSERTPELGLRIALGASSRDILRIVLHNGLQVAAIGGFSGLLLGYFAARAIQAVSRRRHARRRDYIPCSMRNCDRHNDLRMSGPRPARNENRSRKSHARRLVSK